MKHRGVVMIVLIMSLVVIAQAQQTPAPATPTPQPGPLRLTIWLPDVLASPNQPLARAEINRQIQAFNESQDDIIVEMRLKMVNDTGGIMATMRAASSVAPGALPDLTLLRRQDLVPAQRDGLIQTLDSKVPPAMRSSLDTALKLGQVNDQWMGLPYLLELEHLVYRPLERDDEDMSGWSYSDILDRGTPFIFPAGRSNGISDVVFLQYLASGGSLNGENMLMYNADALEATLNFYEQAREAGILDDRLVDYTSANDYRVDFSNGQINSAVFFSPDYLDLLETDRSLRPAPIPTATGQNIALVNGWMWVLVASEADHQAAAMQFITFVMQADNQAAYASTLNMLPSQRAVMIDLLPPSIDEELYLSLLDNAVLPLAESEGGPLASSLQEQVIAILSGQKTAAEALLTLQALHGGA